MRFVMWMLPISMCCFGLMLSSIHPVIGLVISSTGLPLWLLMKWIDIPETKRDETSKLPITSGEDRK